MDRLSYVIILTGRMAAMRRFYGQSIGLEVRERSRERVEFGTAGATLVLHAMSDPRRQGIELRFATGAIEARVADLAGRGARFDPPGIERLHRGRVARLRDPEGNPLSLWEPAEPPAPGRGLDLSAVVNCRDLEAQKRHYRDTLGFEVTMDSPWWVELSAGEAGLGLHPRSAGPEGHHAGPITVGLTIPGLVEWVEQARARGVTLTRAPEDRGYGLFADAVDPDGNALSLREPEPLAVGETLAERLAEAFEDESAPRRAAMRKPVKKGVKAVSRVVVRPQYRSARPGARRRRRAVPESKLAAPRGVGPSGTRQKPKRRRDPKRARTKPALGRLRKAERRTFKSQRQAVAGRSKSRPVKRASRARPARRAAARGSGRR